MTYRVGLAQSDINLTTLEASGLKFSKIDDPRSAVLNSAKSVLGSPYKRGASVSKDAPNAFDCSSLVAWAFVEAGFAIPRIAIDQYVFSNRIQENDLQPGDLVFANTKEVIHTEGNYFSQVLGRDVKEEAIRTETLEYLPGTKVPEGVDHCGVYVGDEKVIHATIKKGFVVEEDLNQSEQFRNIVGFGKIIKDGEGRVSIEIPEDRKDLRQIDALKKELS